MANGSPRVKKQRAQTARLHKSEDVMLRAMKEEFYRRVNPRRAQEIMDSRMIQEDHAAIANLSPEFINRTFDSGKFMQSLGRNDEFSEVGGL